MKNLEGSKLRRLDCPADDLVDGDICPDTSSLAIFSILYAQHMCTHKRHNCITVWMKVKVSAYVRSINSLDYFKTFVSSKSYQMLACVRICEPLKLKRFKLPR